VLQKHKPPKAKESRVIHGPIWWRATPNTPLDDGLLGTRFDEERSEARYRLRFAFSVSNVLLNNVRPCLRALAPLVCLTLI
jgi:hypothetical protein